MDIIDAARPFIQVIVQKFLHAADREGPLGMGDGHGALPFAGEQIDGLGRLVPLPGGGVLLKFGDKAVAVRHKGGAVDRLEAEGGVVEVVELHQRVAGGVGFPLCGA